MIFLTYFSFSNAAFWASVKSRFSPDAPNGGGGGGGAFGTNDGNGGGAGTVFSNKKCKEKYKIYLVNLYVKNLTVGEELLIFSNEF